MNDGNSRQDLDRDRQALLELLLMEEDAQQNAAISPRAIPVSEPIPLTSAQKSIWFIQQLDPLNPAYNVTWAVQLRGKLHVASLQAAIEHLSVRHESLRTRIVAQDGEPAQMVSDTYLHLEIEDLNGQSKDELDAALQAALSAEADAPFDLGRDVLIRARLFQHSLDRYVLVFTAHHLIVDGWSVDILLSDLAATYNSLANDNPPEITEQALQFGDFVTWQQAHQSRDAESGTFDPDVSVSSSDDEEIDFEHRRWWKQYLDGLPSLELPTDRPRLSSFSSRGGAVSVSLPAALVDRVKALGRAEQATPFMTVLAAFQVLLFRYTSQTDFPIGGAASNRTRPELNDVVGLLANTIIFRADLSGEMTFRELVHRVRSDTAEILTRQEVPFQEVVESVRPQRGTGLSPLFQVMFDLKTGTPASVELDELSFNPVVVPRSSAKYELLLLLEETSKGSIEGIWEYSSDLYDRSTIERLAEHFETLLVAACASPDTPLSKLPLLSPKWQQKILRDWNDNDSNFPRDSSIHELFEQQVEQNPERIALCFGDDTFTYKSISERSNQLALRLIQLGVEPGTAVAIHAQRSPELIVGLLAILKAGGFYVPLAPEYPQDRLQWMLNDCGAKVLLTQRPFQQLFADSGVATIYLGEEVDSGQKVDLDQVKLSGAGGNPGTHPAYAIYTSGSTGKPKAVVVPHRAVNRLVKDANYIQLEPSDRVAQASNVSFDAATFEIWGALLNGATLVGVDRETTLTPQEFAAFLKRENVSTLFLTTALFNQVAQNQPDAFATLRNVLFGGELVDPKWVRAVLRAGPPENLLHVYGPTECTTFATWHKVLSVPDDASSVPIGRGISCTQLFVLDSFQQPVPVGVWGELHLGGDGLANGYLNQREATKRQFITNPFAQATDDGPGRMYRTGDIVRWNNSGELEFLGRRDSQVKIRGYRIELGELESALLQHKKVQQAVVTVHDFTSDRRELVAYVAPSSIDTEHLQQWLADRIPSFMLPSQIVRLDRLPLNENGKVDRNALPKPDSRANSNASRIQPRTPVERLVAEVFGEVLELTSVGAEDNFFDLGGHSLLATQVVSRIRDNLGSDLPMRSLFQSPTVSALAAYIEQEKQTESVSSADKERSIRPYSGDELRLSFAQERLWFLDQLEPGNPFYNVPIAIRLRGNLDTNALQKSLAEIVQRHRILRTVLPSVNGEPAQTVLPNTGALQQTDLGHLSPDEQAAEVDCRIAAEEDAPFDLSKGPLVRMELLRLSADRHVLMVTMHHVVADGWSLGVLVRELESLYLAFSSGSESALPELEIQYCDYAHWQRDWLAGDELHRQMSWWKEQLADCPPALELPTDRPRPPAQSYAGSSLKFVVPRDVTEGLRELGRASDATLFMTLLSAWAVLLGRWSNRRDIVIGTPIANRNHVEIEPLIGFFVNTLAMRIDMEADDLSFRNLLSQVRQIALDAFANQDLPFERLVDEIQPERDLSLNPLFQVMFAFQNSPVSDLELPGLEVELIETPRRTALFDLVLDVWDTKETLTGVLEFSTDLFDEATIKRLIEGFQTLLEAITKDPEGSIQSLDILQHQRKQQLIDIGTGPRRNYPIDRPIHRQFEEQAARNGDRVAGHHNGKEISYRAVNERANEIAHRLADSGVKRGDIVGILDHRGLDVLAAMLGTLKSGAAFLPIDPAYPSDRIQHMLADSCVRTLISRQPLSQNINDSQVHIIDLGVTASSAQEKWLQNPTVDVQPDDIAYVLYTSGSTGLPKGAMIRHNGAVNHIFAEFELLGFHQDSCFLQSAPSSSDISVWQFLAPVLIGGRTVIADFETVCQPAQLFELIRDQHVTLIELVPVVLRALISHAAGLADHEQALPDLEWAMVTGEAAPVPLINDWLAIWPEIPLVNAYGPTEAADDICQHVIRQPLAANATTVPIGRPLPNLNLFVLDPDLQLAPLGVAGEICVAGVGVGAGYWNNEAKTQESFVENPFRTSDQDSVLYRTGDLGKWQTDGTLVCLDRIDRQVKVRGFRIELGEVESVLIDHAGVRESAVVLSKTPDDPRLLGYFTPNHESSDIKHRLDALRNVQVDSWEELHEASYVETLNYGDPSFNVIGWDSNYTGQPLPVEDMREYVDTTVQRILSLRPRNLLEIGAGTGLIMFPLLPQLDAYIGTDLSSVAIGQLQKLQQSPELQQRFPGLANALLLAKRADDVQWLEGRSVDTVVLPSVIQYFPSIQYLDQVLEVLVDQVIQPGGAIYLGDVRNLHLLAAFHADVQFHKATDNTTKSDLAQRVAGQLTSEQELAICPKYFASLPQRMRSIDSVQILPKRGSRMNEMSRFRYDVIIRLRNPNNLTDAVAIPRETWRQWVGGPDSSDSLRSTLIDQRFGTLGIRSIPNARVTRARQLADDLLDPSNSHAWTTVADLSATEFAPHNGTDVEPEDLYQLADETGYDIQLNLSVDRIDGSFDALFTKKQHDDEPSPRPGRVSGVQHLSIAQGELSEFANDPLREKLANSLTASLRDLLKERLPNYMVPSDLMMLDEMPLTPAGKIDRNQLPALLRKTGPAADYVAPRTADEGEICRIWQDVLEIEQVGVDDNFFELGGHSLKATLAVSRMQQALEVDVPLRQIFSHPTPAELAQQLASNRAGEGSTGGIVSIARVEDAATYELSNGQQRLWVLSQMEDGLAAYNMPAALHLEGELDVQRLRRAIKELMLRHESLRTVITIADGKPRQRVCGLDELTPLLREIDLSQDSDPDVAARELAFQDADTPFDLSDGVIRIALLKLASHRHVLLFNMHHIVADDWSLNVLVGDFVKLYGGDGLLADLPLQYRDYAAWQNKRLTSGDLEASRDYWLKTLSGPLPALELPTDFPRPTVKTWNGSTLQFQLDSAETKSLENFSRERGATLFMTLVAAVNALLHRHTHQEDLSVGFPIAGREHPDLERQIGFYVNTLPLRTEVHSKMTFATLVDQVKQTCADAYQHQAYPFDRLVDELSLDRDVSRSPLFDVVVVMQTDSPQTLTLPNVEVSNYIDQYDGSKFDLHFVFEVRDDSLEVSIVFNTDLFLPSRIQRMMTHFAELLRQAVSAPNQPIGALNILSPDELERLRNFNPPTTPLPPAPASVIERFESIVQQTPDAIAIVSPSPSRKTTTYADLNRQANQVAHMLRSKGVGAKQIIGLLFDRSETAIVSILAVMKLGAAYLPLDPSHPEDRIKFVLDDSAAAVLLTSRSLDHPLANHGAQCFFVDQILDQPVSAWNTNLNTDIEPEDLAYVIYTSGSTGQPKGVKVSHRNVARLFESTQHWFNFDSEDVWTMFHSYAFDFSVWEIWGALVHGGRLVVVPYEVTRSPQEFHSLLTSERVTVLNQTPSAFGQLMSWEMQQEQTPLDGLRWVIFGGEALELTSLREWFERYGDQGPRLTNMYGITETTVHVTFRPIKIKDTLQTANLIGTPIPDLQIHLLDQFGNPVPIGVVGEIYVSGAGVAQGYLNRSSLTQERFKSEPYRMYRSGDLGRYREDGELQYLGRLDDQIQIRGHRVEPGEIASALIAHDHVADAKVIVDDNNPDRLLAYYVPSAHISATDLRKHTAAQLPDYMHPTAYIPLKTFPLTVNGKLDVRALPRPQEEHLGVAAPYVAPRSELEQLVAEHVREILGLEQAGIDDNFFEIGANSLLLVEINNRLRTVLSREIPIVWLFQHPTIRALAERLARPVNDSAVGSVDDAKQRAARRREARKKRGRR